MEDKLPEIEEQSYRCYSPDNDNISYTIEEYIKLLELEMSYKGGK